MFKPRVRLLYKSDGGARRRALGCRLQILVLLGVFWDGTLLYLPIEVSLSTTHKEIYKNCRDTDHTEIFLGGQFKLEQHPHWSPLED